MVAYSLWIRYRTPNLNCDTSRPVPVKKSDEPKYKLGNHIQISLNNQIIDATIKAVVLKDDGLWLQVDFGYERTALIQEWRVVKK